VSRHQQKAFILTLLALAARAAGQSTNPPPAAPPADPTPQSQPVAQPEAPPVAESDNQPEPSDAVLTDPSLDGGPVVVGTPRESWTGFDLLRLDTALEFRMQSQRDKINQTGQPEQKITETRYRETLDLSTEFIFGHRNLLDVNATVSLGREDIFTNDSLQPESVHEDNLLTLFDVTALVLGSSELPTDIYARRDQTQLNRPFAGSIEETITEEGIGTRYQSDKLTASAQYFHRDSTLKGGFGDIDSNVTQDSLTLNTSILLTPSQRFEAAATLDRIDEQQGVGFSEAYDRRDANLVHTFTFGDDSRPDELRSSLRFYDQTGRQTQTRVRWDEVLTLRHTERLESRYNLTVDNLEVRGDAQQLTRLEASVKHRLFDSLTSIGTIGAQRLSGPTDFSSDNLFASGQLDYTKLVPYGRLDVAAGVAFDTQQNSARGSTVSVIDEVYTFTDGFPIIISRRNIVPGSILITPVAGFPVYVEGLDYRVSFFSDRVEIRGIVGGGFTNGQTLKISYDIGPEAAYDVDTTSTNFSIRYSIMEGWLKGGALYSTYRTVGHAVRASDPSQFTFDDTNDLLLGVEYRRAELETRYEYNIHDSDLSPYTLHRGQVLYSLPIDLGSSLNFEFTRELIDFTKDNNNVTFDRGSLRWISRLDESLDFNAGIEYRNEDSSLNGESQGFDQTVGLNWHWRQTAVYGSFRNSTLEGPGSDQTSQFFQFGIRRTF
jgi:hypothetical protein